MTNIKDIQQFYAATDWMFRLFEIQRGNAAMHSAGLWFEGVSNHAEAREALYRTLATRARLVPGAQVLDAGCGIGDAAGWLAQHYDAQVLGINILDEQLCRARELARAQGLAEHLHFELRDFHATGLDSNSFDLIWALESLCHSPDPAAFFAESRRLLRPGGRLIIADRFLLPGARLSNGRLLLQNWIRDWAMPALLSSSEACELAEMHGFGAIMLEDLSALVRPALAEMATLAESGLAGLGLLPGNSASSVRAELQGCIDQYRSFERGLWCYGLLSAGERTSCN
jgi:cyclopropane fatty-acyl-phospholipid synthase-like methyltransferase